MSIKYNPHNITLGLDKREIARKTVNGFLSNDKLNTT